MFKTETNDREFLTMLIKISHVMYYIGASDTICCQNKLDRQLSVYTLLPKEAVFCIHYRTDFSVMLKM